MAYHCKDKFLTTSKDTYRHPTKQFDYKFYKPEESFYSKQLSIPNISSTLDWFQDYRRTIM